MSDVELTIGDTAPGLAGAVSAVLTGALEIKVNVKRPDRTVFTVDGQIADGPAGGWAFTEFGEGDISVAGRHDVEVQVKFSNGKIQTFARDASGANVWFMVREQYA